MLRSFKRIPVELRRLAVVGVFVGVVVVAVFNSREDNLSTDAGNDGSTQPFRQSEGRQQAEGWFIPTPRVADLPESGMQRLAIAVPLPRPRPNTPGFFYELVRSQGDGEGDYVLIERRCIPKIDMPEPCYLPERSRKDFPLQRE